MDTVICKELIVATLTRRGSGTEHSPIRIITQVFEKDGTLLAESDPVNEPFCAMDLVHFANWCITQGIYFTGKVNKNDVNKWIDSIKS